MPLISIAACDPDRVIGRDGQLPWHLPEDLRLFKKITLGHPIVMGRRTWDSLPRRPLPGRENIVFSRSLHAPGATVVDDASKLAGHLGERVAYLIGGAALYTALLPFCTALILTHVHERHAGDVFFPEFEDWFVPEEILLECQDFHTIRYRNPDPLPLPA